MDAHRIQKRIDEGGARGWGKRGGGGVERGYGDSEEIMTDGLHTMKINLVETLF